jgi:fumarate hydratase subunit alpha
MQKNINHSDIRVIELSHIVEKIKEMILSANYYLGDDIREKIQASIQTEESETGIHILNQLIENADIAANKKMPICQDTGIAVFFVEIGEDIHFHNDLEMKNDKQSGIEQAINEGVRRGYIEGYLRKSIVKDPFDRVNTGDNTPAVIHYDIVPGHQLKIWFSPKGIGSENMSRIYMLKPSEGMEGVKRVALEAIELAGPNPCPPIIVGIGVGGSFEKAAILAKKSLLRPINQHSEDPQIADLEDDILKAANNLGIGPQGFGGRTTALSVNILTYPTHIAGLPVAINMSCHATRHSEIVI